MDLLNFTVSSFPPPSGGAAALHSLEIPHHIPGCFNVVLIKGVCAVEKPSLQFMQTLYVKIMFMWQFRSHAVLLVNQVQTVLSCLQ